MAAAIALAIGIAPHFKYGAALLLAVILAIPLSGAINRLIFRRGKSPSVPPATVNITAGTMWEISLNDVPVGEIPEGTIRSLEAELAQEWRFSLRSWIDVASDGVRALANVLMLMPPVVLGLGALMWLTNAVEFADGLRQILTANAHDFRAIINTLATTFLFVTSLAVIVHRVFLPAPLRPNHYADAWFEEVRLAARVAPRGDLALRLRDIDAPVGYFVKRYPRNVVVVGKRVGALERQRRAL
ncbi:hypothetical protein DF021_32825 [Burkholderia stagnalis]|uniref:DUF2868 domain-containing protein n=1 Tax=Burkholderia stagnalis TaxID=1503054 RepID=A0ABX9YDP3_9BURK|nr:hypothetical protein DF158_32895 [Burkholderia stagnalis]RQQ59831.1 hypothetical protein DF137_33015 [Burkholderia stagnalis]RQQ60196.1 hypothetical protein DF139_32975 [Burkholderia stagnalis]RQQ74757.1 hypothetical protein DF138_32405 [Burkholderia stagnalis]RQQ80354.1 hypothetical protein DF134_33240 [Burkholderia stagnalis]